MMKNILAYLLVLLGMNISFGQASYPTSSNVTESITCIACSVTSASQALNNNPTDYATVHVGISVISVINLDLVFSPSQPGGSTIAIVVEDPTATLDLLSGVTYTLRNGGSTVSNSGWGMMPYNGSSTQKLLYTTASAAFNTIRISLFGVLSVDKTLRVYSAASASGYIPLPVNFIQFAGVAHTNEVQLTWTTASEKNNQYFEMMRSSDGANWQTIGTVDGGGNSQSPLQYEYTDENPLKGKNYYKLKQVDYDENYSFSKIISVTVTSGQESSISLSPNPIVKQSTIWLQLPDTQSQQESITVYLSDLQGRSLSKQIVPLNGNTGQFTINPQWEPGVYILRIDTPGATEQKRIVIH
ncbi:T9SS type A sorting domain-containing protein [Cytophagaceae bacterium YF14B1]|uniref:T9SS type A sorting domain-containing protein n=1 Tax=Xanthocytophaga flava TaxID=3048013 RepID=A0AAE3QLR9_9BACT|nr:T9SS type A sorting domain-containing protein [Xanthocytophaga flavus]MDJ1479261.1 T9SS type A sorting domain-containing protein [Xanthocytophaga flavus]